MERLRIIGARRRFEARGGIIGALNGLDLEVQGGELLVIVGPSGCGKTTLLRAIGGLERLDGGELQFGKVNWTNLPPQQRSVSMAFQYPALLPQMTVLENVAFPLLLRHKSKKERLERARAMCELAGILPMANRFPSSLSGGEQARTSLARALITDPEVLLLDEPLSHLDSPTRRGLRSVIRQLQREAAVTCILVTHDQDEAVSLGDRVAVMRAGRIEQVGTPKELYDKPTTLFVAEFLNPTAINVLPGALVKQQLTLRDYPPLKVAVGEKYWDGDVIACVRPEQIRIGLNETNSTEVTRIIAQVEEIEELRPERLARCTGGGGEWLIRTWSEEPFGPGTRVVLEIAAEHWHIFEKKNGRRVE